MVLLVEHPIQDILTRHAASSRLLPGFRSLRCGSGQPAGTFSEYLYLFRALIHFLNDYRLFTILRIDTFVVRGRGGRSETFPAR
jgi:hypothetical protein